MKQTLSIDLNVIETGFRALFYYLHRLDSHAANSTHLIHVPIFDVFFFSLHSKVLSFRRVCVT